MGIIEKDAYMVDELYKLFPNAFATINISQPHKYQKLINRGYLMNTTSGEFIARGSLFLILLERDISSQLNSQINIMTN